MVVTRTTSLRTVVAIVLAGLLSYAPAAFAAGPDDVDTQIRSVSTHGLDLNAAAGRAELQRRIVIAAASVCGSYDIRDFRGSRDYEQCRAEAVADASGQVRMMIARAGKAVIAVADAGPARP